jgi:DNA-binding transcriptional regulator YiaG
LNFNSDQSNIDNEIDINTNTNIMIKELIENDKTKNDNINIMLSNKLFEAQEELRRTKLRLEVMDLMILVSEDGYEDEEMKNILPAEYNIIDDSNFGFIESIIKDNKNIDEVMSNLNNNIKTISEHQDSRDQPMISFESIFEEISGLKTSVANRGTKKLALGTLLDNTSILMPMQTDLKQINNDNKPHNIMYMLEDLQLSSDLITESLTSKTYEEEQHIKYKQIIKNQEEKIKELNLFKQHVTQERNDFIVCSIEVQVLREKIHRSQTEVKTLASTNVDLVNKWKDAESKLQQANQNLITNGGGNNPMKASQPSTSNVSNNIINFQSCNLIIFFKIFFTIFFSIFNRIQIFLKVKF